MAKIFGMELGGGVDGARAKRVLAGLTIMVPLGVACGILALIMGLHALNESSCPPREGDTDNAEIVQNGPWPLANWSALRSLGKWHDVPADMELPYICEKPGVDREAPCEAPWEPHGSSCYRLVCSWRFRGAARVNCKELGGHIVSIGSAAEDAFVQGMLGTYTAWIGLDKVQDMENGQLEIAYFWDDGVRLEQEGSTRIAGSSSYSNWGFGQPNNLGGDEGGTIMNYWSNIGEVSPNKQSKEYDEMVYLRNEVRGFMIFWFFASCSIPACITCGAFYQARSNPVEPCCMRCLCICSGVSVAWFVFAVIMHIVVLAAGLVYGLDLALVRTHSAARIVLCIFCIVLECMQVAVCSFVCVQSKNLAGNPQPASWVPPPSFGQLASTTNARPASDTQGMVVGTPVQNENVESVVGMVSPRERAAGTPKTVE